MILPGWNDLESVKKISSLLSDVTVLFWVLMATFEVSAVFFPWLKKFSLLLGLPALGKRIRKILAGAGLAALVLAVAGEALVRKYEHRREFLSDEHDKEVAQNFQKEIDAAKADAKTARDENAAAQKSAADAVKDSVEAQKEARLAQEKTELLQKQQGPPPRHLSDKQQRQLAEAIKGTPTDIIVWAAGGDNEAWAFGVDICKALKQAGWRIEANGVQSMIPTGPLHTDMAVFVNPEDTQASASQLVVQLKSFGFDVGVGKSDKVPGNFVKIVLGPLK